MVTAEPAYLANPTMVSAGQDQRLTSGNSNKGQQSGPSSLSGSSSNRSDDQSSSENVDHLSGTPSLPDSDINSETWDLQQQQQQQQQQSIPCSAVHTLERDMPDYDYSHLIERLREAILDYAQHNQGTYSLEDLDKCRHDDWFLSRFLLRQKMNHDDALEMLKSAMRFNNESLANHLRPEDFPAEFYQLGGMIPYGQDRKGNRMLYLRVRLHKKTPEITTIVQSFIYYNIKRLDLEARGKGISMVIDCTSSGLANADMDTLLFIITTLKNYFPKGLSYFLVHELPWILKPFWHIAKAWIPDEHRQLIKFSDSRNVNEFIDQDQLPDFMGGQVLESQYKIVPENCVRLEQAAKLWGIERRLIARVLDKFKADLPPETVARIEDYFSAEAESETSNAAAATTTTNAAAEMAGVNQMFLSESVTH